MAQRLSIHETEFLLKLLQMVESIGHSAADKSHFGEAKGKLIEFYSADRSKMMDVIEQVRIVKDKVKSHLDG